MSRATGSRSRSTGARCARPRASGCWTRPSAATSRSPTSATSRSSGPPVGACRMCMVEVEGIPKLQTSCSTPVKDGMVVYTQTDRVKDAQNAVVEFLLVNHPLDCPVCDKGGECPLQDISYGWGPGPQPLRRGQAQLPQADRALAAGRDRPRALHPLLPLRALLAGGGRGRPAGVPRARRPHLRGHVRRPPLRRAVLGQRDRAVPGRRADQHRLPFPRAAVGHRGRGLGLHALPEPVQHRVHGPRRARRARARARQPGRRRRLAVRQGALGIPGDRRAHERVTQPLVRDGGMLRPATWERALDVAAAGLAQGGRRGGCAGRWARPPTRRGSSLQRIFREALGSGTWTRARAERSRPVPRAPDASRPGRRRRRHRPRIGSAGAGDRPDRRGPDRRPAAAQGGAPLRRAPGGRSERPDCAGRRGHGGAALRAGRRRGAAARACRRRCSRAENGERPHERRRRARTRTGALSRRQRTWPSSWPSNQLGPPRRGSRGRGQDLRDAPRS